MVSVKRFHKYHGRNVVLESEDTVASRDRSYANALVFSEFPLEPNDVFMLEIKETERGWTGDMRIGLTTMNPHDALHTRATLPPYALPDLSSMKLSWIYAISKSRMFNKRRRLVNGRELQLNTDDGSVPLRFLVPTPDNAEQCATDVGSQIGLVYVPTTDYQAELHFIVNGVDQGIFANDIPYTTKPLFVVVDVYGCTKQVKVVQLALKIPTLQELCRDSILKNMKYNDMKQLRLPSRLEVFLSRGIYRLDTEKQRLFL